jgi:tRNA pseudouridine55 synthase
VDKPAGITSHDVVQRVRRILGTRAVGHTGTLDPFATGLLVVLVGRATRLARYLESRPKTYLATARLGLRTTTDDLTGEPLGAPSLEPVAERRVRGVLAGLQGAQRQRPPQFSAKRIAGERSYRKARRGEAVELAEVDIVVHGLDLIEYSPPDLTFRATVSAGTYIRALARDLGERLGSGAHLTSLRREAIGPLRVDQALPLDRLTPAGLLPPEAVLDHLPSVSLDQAEVQAVSHGRAVMDPRAESGRDQEPVALLADGALIAVARPSEGWLHPTVVLDSA